MDTNDLLTGVPQNVYDYIYMTTNATQSSDVAWVRVDHRSHWIHFVISFLFSQWSIVIRTSPLWISMWQETHSQFIPIIISSRISWVKEIKNLNIANFYRKIWMSHAIWCCIHWMAVVSCHRGVSDSFGSSFSQAIHLIEWIFRMYKKCVTLDRGNLAIQFTDYNSNFCQEI